jgi:hypothetical protein
LALGEWDSSEGVAEAKAAIEKQKRNEQPFQEIWNCDSDE